MGRAIGFSVLRRSLAAGNLVLPKVHLDVLGDHLVQDGRGDVLEGSPHGSAHLVLDLSFQEVVQVLAL